MSLLLPPPIATITRYQPITKKFSSLSFSSLRKNALKNPTNNGCKSLTRASAAAISSVTVEKDVADGTIFFVVTDLGGSKIEDKESLIKIENALKEAVNDGVVLRKPGFVGGKKKTDRMFELMDGFLKNDPVSLQKDILHHVEYTVARSRFSFDDFEAYQPIGRSLSNSVINLGIRDQCADALSQLGFEYEILAEQEGDAALGNGGLARLSACQMDSLATSDYPAWGYGLRYQYGLFRQIILDGFQHEQPDYWFNFGNPWEIERVHVSYPFYGTVKEDVVNGKKCKVWIPGETVEAVAYDNPIPGYGTRNTINLRLWAAKPSDGYDIESYNTGDYINAIVNRQKAEIISNVLYPDDRSYQGKELRLKQQYFFVSASLQDIIRRFKDVHGNFDDFPDKVALQLNDTHPSISIAELMRVLLDEEHLGWKKSWNIVKQVFSFTTHTVLLEALEKVPVDLFQNVLPRHLQNIRVANLSIVCSHTVNGVSRAHYELLKTRDFYELWPEKFQYKTNGVTQVKKINKMRLAEYIETMSGVKVSLDAMFDVQIKYGPNVLRKVFIPDYNVSVAELVIPGSDLSQHISTAGHEASGTGSMKFLMNGCLLLATADGSTNEIIEEIGAENMVTSNLLQFHN
ncbi:hypothetical protein L1987_28947 [Smallanthus sonchifolius]|uniref:Uncharacterized protein n=1 Tax=Smallanthus sonchifolius TaxID=185202 RepID=A0ACB9HYJ2_9ASTR|nr:hypothetical protein L1987_28947 [Smallanthus sonchifolius]